MNCVHLLTPGVKRARKSSDSLEEEEEVMLMLPDVSTAYTTMEPNFAIIILDTKEIIAIWIVFFWIMHGNPLMAISIYLLIVIHIALDLKNS